VRCNSDPAGTPKPIVDRLHAEFVAAMQSKAFGDVMTQLAAEAAPNRPEQFASLIARETRKYEGIVKHSNAKVD
jgi:tripartite-type tricarboxylate transporter receptor subunit TctC